MSWLGLLKPTLAIKCIIVSKKRLSIIVISIVLLLLIPLIAMQLTDEVNWTVLDFVVAAALLLATGLLCEFTLRKVNQPKYRIAICVALLLLLFLIWAELAVGIF
jgi:peptidoglycan/LPS O-acetylase OafA/YrhL